MPVIAVLIVTFFLALILHLRGMRALESWLLSCCIVPVFVLASEFILPYMGGGASMWPIAIIVGSIYGAIVGSIGVFIASIILKFRKKKPQPQARADTGSNASL